MAQLAEHPTVKQFRARETTGSVSARPQSLDRERLRQVCLDAGVDDACVVEMDRPEIADQKTDTLLLLPTAKRSATSRSAFMATPPSQPTRTLMMEWSAANTAPRLSSAPIPLSARMVCGKRSQATVP